MDYLMIFCHGNKINLLIQSSEITSIIAMKNFFTTFVAIIVFVFVMVSILEHRIGSRQFYKLLNLDKLFLLGRVPLPKLCHSLWEEIGAYLKPLPNYFEDLVQIMFKVKH